MLRPRRSFVRCSRLLVGTLVAIAVTGCGTSIAGTARPADRGSATVQSPGDIGPIPTGLAKYYTQQLSWGPCADFAQTDTDEEAFDAKDVECTRLDVPVSYTDITAGDANIGVLRASSTGEEIGSIVFNPGGPGGSGMSMVATFASYGIGTDLRQRFDFVGFDPRGTGASRPVVSCRTNSERDAERAANLRTITQAGIKALNAQSKKMAADCAERTGKAEGIDGTAFLSSVGTRDVAKDMDVLRAALGDRKLSYVGYSYGTRLGTEYAEQFPDNVRAMILDGAVDPQQDSTTEILNQGKGFQQAFEAYAQKCAGESSCPLGTDPAKATEAFQQLLRPLLDKPVTLSDGRVITFDDATTGAVQAMYADSLWPDLTKGLTELGSGKGDTLMALADDYEDRDSSGKYTPMMDAFTAIRCMDDPRLSPEEEAKLNTEYFQQAPFLDPGDPIAPIKDTCDFWPAQPTLKPHLPNVPGLATVVVVSTTGDPATPYQAGVDLAKALKASLISVKGTRHTAYLGAGLTCVDKMGDAYLIDLTVPKDGATC